MENSKSHRGISRSHSLSRRTTHQFSNFTNLNPTLCAQYHGRFVKNVLWTWLVLRPGLTPPSSRRYVRRWFDRRSTFFNSGAPDSFSRPQRWACSALGRPSEFRSDHPHASEFWMYPEARKTETRCMVLPRVLRWSLQYLADQLPGMRT